MLFTDFSQLDLSRLPSPCFVVDEVAVERNLKILHDVERQSGTKVLQALKAFSMFSLAPLTKHYLSGTCASGVHEAKLANQHYGGEVHVYSPAYTEADLGALLNFANHIVFNSCSQLLRFEHICKDALEKRPELSFGLRVNPQHSEGGVTLYDPCAPGSRLGVTAEVLHQNLDQKTFRDAFTLISGLHFHTLCEHDFPPLERTIAAVEKQFGGLLTTMRWLNLGGGHHITLPNYQVDALVNCLTDLSERYQLQLYLEPGETIAIGSGILCAEVLDVSFNETPQAILNTSATCHMPDTLEMPYRPDISHSAEANIKPYSYRIGGLSCLAGDIIGDYSFDQPLVVGQRLIFEDMAHYTMVKTSTFNGTPLPAIVVWNSQTDNVTVVKTFSYDDFESRLS